MQIIPELKKIVQKDDRPEQRKSPEARLVEVQSEIRGLITCKDGSPKALNKAQRGRLKLLQQLEARLKSSLDRVA